VDGVYDGLLIDGVTEEMKDGEFESSIDGVIDESNDGVEDIASVGSDEGNVSPIAVGEAVGERVEL
jgi:hypothetical protein